MSTDGPPLENVEYRLRGRVHRRYLRWFARQPVESVFYSAGWRSFWRSYRRRSNAFFASRPVVVLGVCVGVCGILVFVGLFGTALARILPLLRDIFFAPPENRSFAGPAEQSAVALTRLTILQSMVLPLLLWWGSQCFRNSSAVRNGVFYKRYPSSAFVFYRGTFLCCLVCSAAVAVAT